MPLTLKKLEDEGWRHCVKRVASKYGLKRECLEEYDRMMESGLFDEATAAWGALYEWDCLDFAEED